MTLIRLDEYCESVRDGTHDTPKPTSEGKYLITSKAINNDSIDYSTAYYISVKDFDAVNKRSKVDKYDVIMTMIGSVGRLHFIDYEPDYAIKNIALFKVGDYYKAKWLYYYLSSNDVQNYLEAVANGTSQHFVGLGYLRKFKINDISERNKKIVDILTKYDTLIKLNNKRIKLLEKTAEEIYKEWFVRFRFPGYEKTEFEDGIPKGWNLLRLEEFGIKLTSGSRPKGGIDDSLLDGVPSLGAESIGELGSFDFSSVKIIPFEFADKMKNGKSGSNDILIYKDGAYIGKTTMFKNGFPFDHYSVNEHVFIIYSEESEYQNYLYFTLHQKSYFDLMQTLNKNAAQPGLSKPDINRIKIRVPVINIARQFNRLINPILDNIFLLAKENQNLTKQRDYLLPRLLSGKLEV